MHETVKGAVTNKVFVKQEEGNNQSINQSKINQINFRVNAISCAIILNIDNDIESDKARQIWS